MNKQETPHRMSEELFIAITGNPVDGFVYYGPFQTERAAAKIGKIIDKRGYWVVDLIDVSEEDAEIIGEFQSRKVPASPLLPSDRQAADPRCQSD